MEGGTYFLKASKLKIGDYVVIKNRPCKIVEIKKYH
jgi:translation elongation factor P/translation initiation factor 5A